MLYNQTSYTPVKRQSNNRSDMLLYSVLNDYIYYILKVYFYVALQENQNDRSVFTSTMKVVKLHCVETYREGLRSALSLISYTGA